MHQLADVESVLKPVTVLPGKTHPLIRDVNLVLLVILEVTSVKHPEVKIDVKLESIS